MARGRDLGRPEGACSRASSSSGWPSSPWDRWLPRRSALFIGIKGAPPGSAVEASGPGNVTASVGRPRPLAFTQEAFSLR